MKKMPIGLVGYDYHTAGDHTVQGLIVDYYNIYTSIFLTKDNISIYQNLRIIRTKTTLLSFHRITNHKYGNRTFKVEQKSAQYKIFAVNRA
jgi:hypothetical protein